MASFSVPRRRNGFTPPYSRAQISAWVALLLTMIQFPLFISPIMQIEASIPVTIFFFGLVFGAIYHGVLSLAIDPMDPHLGKHLKENHSEEPSEAQEKESATHRRLYAACNPPRDGLLPTEPMKQCWICDTQVAEHSMHCKFCNKCVYHFDHHCMWLNTCIGEGNYRSFFRTNIFVFCMELAHFIIQTVLVIDIFLGGPTKDRADDWFNAGTYEVVTAVLIFFACFNGIALFLIGQLLWFHLGLQRENLSTYKYIVRDHQRKRDKTRFEGEVMQLRYNEIAKAKGQGKKLEAFSLQMGDQCRQAGCAGCDPLDVPKVGRDPDPENGFGATLGPSLSGPSLSQEEGSNNITSLPLIAIDSKVQSNGNGNSGGVSFIRINDGDEQKEPDNGPSCDEVSKEDEQKDHEPAAEAPFDEASKKDEQKGPETAAEAQGQGQEDDLDELADKDESPPEAEVPVANGETQSTSDTKS